MQRKHVIVTDLDLSDCQQQQEVQVSHDSNRKVHKKRHSEKQVHTISGNFNRRSRSAENRFPEHNSNIKQSIRLNSYFNEVVISNKTAVQYVQIKWNDFCILLTAAIQRQTNGNIVATFSHLAQIQ